MTTCSRANACSMKGRRPIDGAAKTGGPTIGRPAAAVRALGVAVGEDQVAGRGLEKLLGRPARKHLFQDAAVVGIRQVPQGAR